MGKDDSFKVYSPNELMIGGGLLKDNGKPNTQLYNQWLYRGIFGAKKAADGPGTVSCYGIENIIHVAIVVRLREFYVPLKKAALMAQQIIDLRKKKKGDLVTIVPGEKTGLEVCLGDTDLQKDVLRLDISRIEKEVYQRLEELGDTERFGKGLPRIVSNGD